MNISRGRAVLCRGGWRKLLFGGGGGGTPRGGGGECGKVASFTQRCGTATLYVKLTACVVVRGVLDYLRRDMTHTEGGLYSAEVGVVMQQGCYRGLWLL
jgi:hypothetical protein